MSKQPFRVTNWLSGQGDLSSTTGQNVQNASARQLLDQTNKEYCENFQPDKFLLQGWKGTSLPSKYTSKLQKLQDRIIADVKFQFSKTHFNKSLRNSIYLEFLSFCNTHSLQFDQLETQSAFWYQIHDEHGPNKKQLDAFKEFYAKRIAVIYLLKIRFLILLSDHIGMKINENILLLPNSSFTQIFKKGSSSELKCQAFHSNHFSWYLPKFNIATECKSLITIFKTISITELYKVFSINEIQPVSTDEEGYSHSLSHVNVGKFFKTLLKDFPKWIKKDDGQFWNKKDDKRIKVKNCKFTGNNLESLSLAHWLAIEEVNEKISEALSRNEDPALSISSDKTIICPTFVSDENIAGLFIKLSYELQFLTALIKQSELHGESPVPFLCQVYRLKEKSLRENLAQQFLFHEKFLDNNDIQYDNIFINLTNFPKNNVHFYLINQISEQINHLKDNGHLIVFSLKKLFIPSQTQRTQALLKSLKIEGCFTLDQLKGRGEIAPYIYIFSKNKTAGHDANEFLMDQDFNDKAKKHPCLSFRITGELSTMQKFNVVLDGFDNFFNEKRLENTSMYQRELDEDFVFEFYQDAIVEGRLINSSSKDTSKITHPNFFRNILKACSPLNHYFMIEQISDTKENNLSSDLLGLNLRSEQKYGIILILDMSETNSPKIEFVSAEQYAAKLFDYGEAFYTYFGLIPKVKNINLNIFRSFFESQLGKQIIHVSVTGGHSKLKSKVESILVPNFFGETKFLPTSIENGLSILNQAPDELSSLGPANIFQEFDKVNSVLYHLASDYPWHTLGLVINFQKKVNDITDKVNTEDQGLDFTNPSVINWLIGAKKRPLFPQNEDIYTEFHISAKEELNYSVDMMEIKKVEKGMNSHHCLEIYRQGKKLMSFYSDIKVLSFLEFLINSARGQKIINILQYTEIPTLEEFKDIESRSSEDQEQLSKLDQKMTSIINHIFQNQISSSLK